MSIVRCSVKMVLNHGIGHGFGSTEVRAQREIDTRKRNEAKLAKLRRASRRNTAYVEKQKARLAKRVENLKAKYGL